MESDKNSIERPLMLAMKYLSYRPRSVYEIEEYLKKKFWDKNIVKKTIEILLERNYLNDKDFTKIYIETMVRNRPKSKFAIKYALKKKGVDLSIIEPFLEQYDDQSLAIKAVEPKIERWQNFDKKKFKKKMMNFLVYRGFNYEICITTLNYFKNLAGKYEN
ncbi:MAG: regulatory protein RecX [Thermodesulfobacteriota bacterium]